MHHVKMRTAILGATVGLLGLAALLFSIVYSSHDAQATTPVGPWKLIGVVTSVKKSPNGTEWVLTTPKSAKAAALVKGQHVIVINATPASNSYPPASWRVLAVKNVAGLLEIRLTKTILDECTKPPPPVGGPMELYSGPCLKPVPDEAKSGIYDIVVDNGNPAADLYHCIARWDENIASSAIKLAAVCFDNTGALGQGAAAEPINSPPGEGTGTPGLGPPPPPPYAVAPPAKGLGSISGGTATITSCFPDVGKSTNIITVVSIPDPKGQIVDTGKKVGTAVLYLNESNAACDALTPVGAGLPPLGLTFYPALDYPACPGGVCQHVAWRTGGDTDYDNDGCTDMDELWTMKPGITTKCGDDPWNPFDVTPPSTDVSGSYSLTAITLRQDCAPATTGSPTECDDGSIANGGDHITGFYYDCVADINQTGKALTARVLCYIDSAGITVNPQAAIPAGTASCGALPAQAAAQYCGDGVSGAPPPGNSVGTYPTNKRLFADVDDKHAVLTGEVDNAQNVIKLRGCFEDRDDFAALGHVYVDAVINLHTGHGQVNLWSNVATAAACLQVGGPGGASGVVPVHITRQALKAAPPAGRDGDSDGCPNKAELGDTATTGGLRDPSNHYDYMEATQNGQNRINDIIAVVNQYFIDDPVGVPDMKSLTDRTAIPGANAWNLGPPNGQQRVDDILAQVKQYFHDC